MLTNKDTKVSQIFAKRVSIIYPVMICNGKPIYYRYIDYMPSVAT